MFLSELVFRQRRPVMEGVVQKTKNKKKKKRRRSKSSVKVSADQLTGVKKNTQKTSLANLNSIVRGLFSNRKGI